MNSRTTSPESLKHLFLSLQREKFPNSHQGLLVDQLNVCRRSMMRWGSLGHMQPPRTLRLRSVRLPNASRAQVNCVNLPQVGSQVATG